MQSGASQPGDLDRELLGLWVRASRGAGGGRTTHMRGDARGCFVAPARGCVSNTSNVTIPPCVCPSPPRQISLSYVVQAGAGNKPPMPFEVRRRPPLCSPFSLTASCVVTADQPSVACPCVRRNSRSQRGWTWKA